MIEEFTVYGLSKFRDYFKDYCDNYILIGGAACNMIFNNIGDKHKKDVVRLATLLTNEDECILPQSVKDDMREFIKELTHNPVEPKVLGIVGPTATDIEYILKKVYCIEN